MCGRNVFRDRRETQKPSGSAIPARHFGHLLGESGQPPTPEYGSLRSYRRLVHKTRKSRLRKRYENSPLYRMPRGEGGAGHRAAASGFGHDLMPDLITDGPRRMDENRRCCAYLLAATDERPQGLAVLNDDNTASRVDDPGSAPKAKLLIYRFAASLNHVAEFVLRQRYSDAVVTRAAILLREHQQPPCQPCRQAEEGRVLYYRASPS